MTLRGRGPARLALALCFLGIAAGSVTAYEQRANTISAGIQGGGGVMSGTDAYNWRGTDYRYDRHDWGGGLAFHLRYSLDRSHAVGISFEDLRFVRKPGLGSETPKQYQLNNFMADYYVYINRRAKVTPYVVLGLGFHRPTFRVSASENIIPPEGFVANLGTGLEYFVRRMVSIDTTLKGFYIPASGGRVLAAELMIGFQYYLLR